jgi:hypothetical protein
MNAALMEAKINDTGARYAFSFNIHFDNYRRGRDLLLGH